MKHVAEMTRKEFLSLPEYEDWHTPLKVKNIYILQTKRKHDSGYACMVSAANIKNKLYILGTHHDVLDIKGARIDCFQKNGVLRFFPDFKHTHFLIEHRLSDFSAVAV